MKTFNSTLEELKSSYRRDQAVEPRTFNSTLEELKYDLEHKGVVPIMRF